MHNSVFRNSWLIYIINCLEVTLCMFFWVSVNTIKKIPRLNNPKQALSSQPREVHYKWALVRQVKPILSSSLIQILTPARGVEKNAGDKRINPKTEKNLQKTKTPSKINLKKMSWESSILLLLPDNWKTLHTVSLGKAKRFVLFFSFLSKFEYEAL